MIPIDPQGMDFFRWFDETSKNISGSVPVMKVQSENDWKDWGRHVREVLMSTRVPNPDHFTDWREWAIRFNQVLLTL